MSSGSLLTVAGYFFDAQRRRRDKTFGGLTGLFSLSGWMPGIVPIWEPGFFQVILFSAEMAWKIAICQLKSGVLKLKSANKWQMICSKSYGKTATSLDKSCWFMVYHQLVWLWAMDGSNELMVEVVGVQGKRWRFNEVWWTKSWSRGLFSGTNKFLATEVSWQIL